MKKIVAFVLSAVMAAACAGCGSVNGKSSKTQSGSTAATGEATVATAAPETLPNSVKKQIDQALSTAEFQGVMQISRGGSVIYQFVKGTDDNGQPLTIDASLPIASVSKQFCAAGVMLLSEKNKLSVDDTLDKYYPEYKFAKQLTLKNLLTMSSGIPDYYEKFMDGSALGTIEADNVKKIKEAIFGEELYFEPGDDYAYSNSNYFLLADIIEQVSGVPYHEYIRTNIFEPLGMTSSGFVEEISGNPAWASALSNTEAMNETTHPALAKGAGDIVTNAADMDKWMSGLSGVKVISAESFRQMTEDVNENSYDNYGYGLNSMPYDGVGHVGNIPPHFYAVDYLNTDKDVYLFAATNNLRGSSDVQQKVLDALFQ